MANASSPLPQMNAFNNNIIDLQFTNMGSVANRNVFVSIFSIALSLSSGVPIIIMQLKRPIKILLINLVACDVMSMTAALIFGSYAQMVKDSRHGICFIIVFLIIYGSLLCSSAVLAISLNNFLAIFYPYRYNNTVTTKSVSIGVIAMWIGLAILSFGCIGVKLKPGPACVPLATIPSYGVLLLFLVALAFRVGVITMNVMLCIRLRNRRRIHIQPTVTTPGMKIVTSTLSSFNPDHRVLGKKKADQPSTSRSSSMLNETGKDQEPIIPLSALPKEPRGPYLCQPGQLQRRLHNKSVGPMERINACTDQKNGTSCFVSDIVIQPETAESNRHSNHDSSQCHPIPLTENDKGSDTEPNPHSDGSTTRSDNPALKINNDGDINSCSLQTNIINDFVAVRGSKTLYSHPGVKGIQGLESRPMNRTPESSASKSVRIANTVTSPNQASVVNANDARYRRLSVSMIIIALWCCILSMPFLAFMFYMGAVADNKFKANYSPFGVVATTFLVINIMGDPVIYAWRFINWTVLFQKIGNICRRDGT